MFIKKDTIIALTTGEYSDYCLREHVVALKDFNVNQIKLMFLEQYTGKDWDQDQYFIPWIINNNYVGLLEEDKVVELYIGGYGKVDFNA